MNMTEIEGIETRIPAGMRLEINRLEINQQQRDLLVARAKRERGEYIAAGIRNLVLSLRQIFVRQHVSTGTNAPLGHQR